MFYTLNEKIIDLVAITLAESRKYHLLWIIVDYFRELVGLKMICQTIIHNCIESKKVAKSYMKNMKKVIQVCKSV